MISKKARLSETQEQSPIGVPMKRCSENMQQIYRRTPMKRCDFNRAANFIEITLLHVCSPVNLLHIFRTVFTKNTSGRMLLEVPTTFYTDQILKKNKHFLWIFSLRYKFYKFNVLYKISFRRLHDSIECCFDEFKLSFCKKDSMLDVWLCSECNSDQ